MINTETNLCTEKFIDHSSLYVMSCGNTVLSH